VAFEMPAISALVPELVKKGPDRDGDRAGSVGLSRLPARRSVRRWNFRGKMGNSLRVFSPTRFIRGADHRTGLVAGPAKGTAEEEEQRRSGFKEGLRFVRSDRTILSMIALIALITIFVFPSSPS